MKIAAVIPTLGERPELQPLVAQLAKEGVAIITLTRPEVHNIHTLWNEGVQLAKKWGADYIALLNDDISLPPNTLTTMGTAMKEQDLACAGVDPKAKFGIAKDSSIKEVSGRIGDVMAQITTWCFMVKANAWVDIDEAYQWWWGVGDLFEKIMKDGGRLGQMSGIGILHIGSGTAHNHHWTQAAKRADERHWRETH